MVGNRYSYNGHTDLQPADLFFWVAADQLCKRFGVSDLAAAAGILLGQNDVPVPGKLRGAVAGTSVVSMQWPRENSCRSISVCGYRPSQRLA